MARTRDQRTIPAVFLLVAVALVGARVASSMLPAAASSSGGGVHWLGVEEGAQLARMSGKPLLLDFTAEWCAPCHALDAEVFADAALAATINERFVPVRLVDRKREEGQNSPLVASLQQRFRVENFPTVLIVDADGRERARMEGFSGRSEFERIMETAAR